MTTSNDDAFALFDYQKRAGEQWAKEKRAFIAFPMSYGKTRTACYGMSLIKPSNALVVCPAMVVKQWEDHLATWDIPGKVTSFQKLKNLPYEKFDCLVVDEAHNIKSRSSGWTELVKTLGKEIPYVAMMTGTPVWDRPSDIWQPLNILHGYKVSMSWFNFCTKFCDCTFWEDKLSKPGKLKKEMRQEFQDFVQKYLIFPSEKNNVLIPPVRFIISETAPAPESDTMYFTWLRESADRFAQTHDIPSIHGDLPVKRRLDKINQARAQNQSLVATIASVGVGINNLIGYRVGVFLELTWTPAEILQAIGRLARIGSPHDEIQMVFVAPKGSIQERMAFLLKSKLLDYATVMMDNGENATAIANDILGGEMTDEKFAEMAAQLTPSQSFDWEI